MANIASARKRARQAVNNRAHNMALRSRFPLGRQGRPQAAAPGRRPGGCNEAFKQAVPLIDKTVSKGLIHRNKAARHKSRLNARIRDIAQS